VTLIASCTTSLHLYHHGCAALLTWRCINLLPLLHSLHDSSVGEAVSSTFADVAGGFWAPFATFVSISIGYAIVAGSLVAFVEPLAAGSGIPEIKTYLNGIHIKGLLTVTIRVYGLD